MCGMLRSAALAVALVVAAGLCRVGPGLSFVAGSGSGGSASATVSATAIAAGLGHSCALTSTGGVKCWGYNGVGQLGDGTHLNRFAPGDVSGLGSGVTAIATGGYHSCALTSTGGVKCWGNNHDGQLGDGTYLNRFRPGGVSGLGSGVTAIATGDRHSCALTSDGAVKCWGLNAFGQLGDGTRDNRVTPVEVSGLGSGVTAIGASWLHSCALTSAGGVKCWGHNYYDQLGDGTTSNYRFTPVDVSGLSGGVTAIATGGRHSCALTSAGGVKCWGHNYFGQLGDGTTARRWTPVDVSGLSGGVTAIATGGDHGCALTSTGGVTCWGRNDDGQLGGPGTPVDVSGLNSRVTAIATGDRHSCALTSAGGVRCWGLNDDGQLGDGTTRNRSSPVAVIGLVAANATLTILSRSVMATPARLAPLELRCGSQARCGGTLTLTTGAVKLGSHAFSIAAGRTQTLNVKLTTRGFELLVRAKRLATRARIRYRQPAGGTTTATRTITLTAPKS